MKLGICNFIKFPKTSLKHTLSGQLFLLCTYVLSRGSFGKERLERCLKHVVKLNFPVRNWFEKYPVCHGGAAWLKIKVVFLWIPQNLVPEMAR